MISKAELKRTATARLTDANLLLAYGQLDRLRNQFIDLDVYWAGSSTATDAMSVAITGFERIKRDSVFDIIRAKQAKGYTQLID